MDSSDRYRAVVLAAERAGHSVVIFQDKGDREAAIIFASRATARALGYTRRELLGMSLADIVHPESAARVFGRYRRRQSGHDPKGIYGVKVVRHDGSEAPVDISAVRARIDGRPATVVFITNVAERRRAEDMLHESEERYRHLVENIGAVLYSVDADGVTTYISPVFQLLFGHDPADLVGKKFADFIHPDDLHASMESYREVMSGGPSKPWECRMALPGEASVFWVQGHNRPEYRNGVIAGFQGVLVDVTARRQVDDLKDQFIGLVSHELRTPLTVIMGAVNTALSEGPRLSARVKRRLLKDAASEADLLSHILDNLLELSRSRADRLNLQLELVVLAEALERTARRVRGGSRRWCLVMDLPETLPRVRADRIRLQQVLYNLLDNAAKYSSGREVRVSARRKGKDLVVSVHDRGPGIPPEDQARLFRPFERIRGDLAGGAQGIGLGLMVCRSLVEAHGGSIWLEPDTGEGNTFSFTIPIRGPKAEQNNR